jgi:hypothetical protein
MTRVPATPGVALKRWADRVFDKKTLDTVVLPALADLQHECAEARGSSIARSFTCARAYVGVWRAILFTAAGLAISETLRTSWTLALRLAFALAIFTGALVWSPFADSLPGLAGRVTTPQLINFALLLLPQALALALPCAFVVALATARQRTRPTGRMLLGATGSSLVCGVGVLVLTTIVVPWSNQAYRVAIYDVLRANDQVLSVTIPKGLAEMTLGELWEIERHPASARQAFAARVHIQQRMMLCLSPLMLGLFSGVLLAPLRSRLLAVAGSLALVFAFSLTTVTGNRLADLTGVAAAVWLPTLLVGAVGLWRVPKLHRPA